MTPTAVAVEPGETAPEAPDARPPDDAPAGGGIPPRRGRTAALVAGLTALVGLPLFVALAVVRTPTWHPSVDLALIEMRVRDVGTQYNPLLGAGGRFGAYGEQGNHPGPLPYYLLTPVYRLLGSDSWAFEAAAVVIALAAVATGIWLAHRRARTLGALGATLGYLVLVIIYEPLEVLSPWNPNVAMLWWPTLLLALWGILCRDYPVLPVAVFAASFCAQAHVSYLGLSGGLAVLVGVVVLVDVVRNPPLRRPLLRWTLGSALLGLLLWAPPIYEQFQTGTGNMSIVFRSFTHPAEDTIPWVVAWKMIVAQLDLGIVFGGSAGGEDPAAWAFIALWVASIGGAVWLRRPWLTRLHIVTAAAMATSFIAIVRITGTAWWYLVYWGRGTAILAAGTTLVTGALVGATLWSRRTGEAGAADEADQADDTDRTDDTGQAEVAPPPDARVLRILPVAPPPPVARRAAAGLGAAIAVALVMATVDGATAEGFDVDLSRRVDNVLPDVERALLDDGPRDQETLITFVDPTGLGSTGFSTMLALERDGFTVRSGPAWEAAVGEHRVTTANDVDRELHVSVGDGDIALWRRADWAEEVASYDPRTPKQREQVGLIEMAIATELEERGLEREARLVETVRMAAATDPDMPADVKDRIAALGEYPQPVAVFLSSQPGEVPRMPTAEELQAIAREAEAGEGQG